MILYSFRRCPYAMRARYALALANINVELREVSLKNKPSSMFKYSPKGTVPILVIGNNVYDESMDIIKYAFNREQDSCPDIFGVDYTQKQKIAALIAENDQHFTKLLTKYKYFERYLEYSQKTYRSLIEELFLDKFETLLEQHAYLAGGNKTIADIAIFPFIRQFAKVDLDYFTNSQYKNLISWLENFTNNKIFDQIMFKNPIWQPGNKPVFLLSATEK